MYQRKDPRIIVIHKKNGGLSDARNAGIRYSSGDYLMFVDGDDYINNEMCQILLDTSLQTNSDIVSCNFFRCNQHASTPSVMSLRDTPKSYKGKELFLYYFTKGPSTDLTVVWNKLYKRKLFFDKHMIRFPVGRNQEDESTTYKLYYLSKKITIIPTPLYYYTTRAGSITSSYKYKDLFDEISYAKDYIKFSRETAPETFALMEYACLVHYLRFAKKWNTCREIDPNRELLNQLESYICNNFKHFLSNPYAKLSFKFKYVMIRLHLYTILYH